MSTNTNTATLTSVAITGVEIWISTVGIATITGMWSPVNALRTQRRKKEKCFISGTTCYSKGNYSVNVSVLRLVKKELGFEKTGLRKGPIFFLDVNSVEFTRVYRVLTRSNSSNLPILPETEFTSELTRFWYLKT